LQLRVVVKRRFINDIAIRLGQNVPQPCRIKRRRALQTVLGNDDFVLIARTDAASARYTPEGVMGSVDLAVERTLAYARAEIHNRRAIDLAWCEFPDQDFAAISYWATKVRREHPDLGLAINLSSSFDWTDP
jgi:isocitrate lyase